MAKLLQLADSLEMNELHRAVQENRLEAVTFLVKRGADITYPINKDQTPLYIAVKNNHQDITEVLCKSTSRVGVRSMIDKQTLDTKTAALHLAAVNNSFESTRFLLSCGANFEIRDKESRRIQNLTTDENIKELVKSIEGVFKLIENDDNQALLEKLNSLPIENVSAVMYARKQLPPPSLISPYQDYSSQTVLQMAMKKNNLERIEIITNFRIDKLKQADWQTCANIDEFMQHSKVARRHFSNLNASHTYEDHTYNQREATSLLNSSSAFLQAYKEQGDRILDNQPLLIIIEESLEHFGYRQGTTTVKRRLEGMMICDSGHTIQILKLCVIAPMLLFMQTVYTSELLEAIKRNDLARVETCLTGHPDLNRAVDSNGCTLLHYAIRNEKITKLLLNFGADPTIVNKSKESPLHVALRRPEGCSISKIPKVSTDILLPLFENTSDDKLAGYLNERRERDGSTPLHTAASTNNYRLVGFLLRKGCVYCSRDTSGCTPSYDTRGDEVRNLLKCIEQSFEQARDRNVKELMKAMKRFDENTLLAVCGARNEENLTLDQVLEREGHANEAGVVRKMLDDLKGVQKMIARKCRCKCTDID